MKRSVFYAIWIVSFLLNGCGPKTKDISLEPETGLIIRITDMNLVKSQGRMIGFVEIENKTEKVAKVSNKELFLYCGKDSSSAHVKMPGEWEIDKGLINVSSAKTVRYQVYWEVSHCAEPSSINVKYIKALNREEE